VTRTGLCAAAAIAALVGTAGVSSAATSVETYPPVRDPQLPTAGGVFVRGDDHDNFVRVDYRSESNEFLILDAIRRMKLRPGQAQVEPCRLHPRRGLALCPKPGPNDRVAAITVRLRAGDDGLRPRPGVRTPIAANGGRGADEVEGGGGDDVLKGGPDADVVRGLDGDDNLTGGEGDELLGGQGDDVILADYGTAEAAIDCDAGEDRAFVDAGDPPTVDCEQVTVRDPQ